MAGEYVYTLQDLTKQHGAKTILEDVNLSFFFGARIGVIGGKRPGKNNRHGVMAGPGAEVKGNWNMRKKTMPGHIGPRAPPNSEKDLQRSRTERGAT